MAKLLIKGPARVSVQVAGKMVHLGTARKVRVRTRVRPVYKALVEIK
jgi:hypothetical protein